MCTVREVFMKLNGEIVTRDKGRNMDEAHAEKLVERLAYENPEKAYVIDYT